MSRGQAGFVPGTKWVCPRDKPRFSPYFTTQWKPSLSLGQTQFVPGTNPVCPGDIPGTKGGTKSLCVKSLCAFFRSLGIEVLKKTTSRRILWAPLECSESCRCLAEVSSGIRHVLCNLCLPLQA